MSTHDVDPGIAGGATDALATAIRERGFARLHGRAFAALLPAAAVSGWATFAASWNDLGVDTYMADGGRYRRRRFATFSVAAPAPGVAPSIERKPHQPHYQSRDYNPLNGGVERWFMPIADAIADHPLLRSIMARSAALFGDVMPPALRPSTWHAECHQFRIEARADAPGQPTPEGLHRDGVDFVIVVLVARANIAEGVTTIHDLQRREIGSFTLSEPLDAAFVDDGRVYHGVTAVRPLDPARPGCRDVLVVTFRRA
ncbi:MAG TPA: 2OG-Fe dioxygenase family protein [Burkholderiaceae bacterium]|nr:2OG-Fe dioxygenase family protein [Burkholderiaceae bacterium]